MLGLGVVLNGHLHQHAAVGVHRRFPQLLRVHLAKTLVSLKRVALAHLLERAGEFLVVIAILHVFALRHLVQRRHADIHVPVGDQPAHIAIEEREQNRADVRAALIRVGQDDYLVVFQMRKIEVLADARAQRGDHRTDFLVRQHLIQTLFLGVQRLSAQRKNRLKATVAPLLGAAAGRITLHDEQLVELRVAAGAG